MTLALALGYAGLLLLALLALLYSRWPGWLKGLLVAAVTALYFVGHEVLRAVLGLPSPDPLPERFVMLSALVEEPTAKAPGSVYLWVSPFGDGAGLQPRAYRLPYSKALHEQVEGGLRRSRDGVSQMGSAQLVRSGNGEGIGWLTPHPEVQEVRIRDLPARQLPEK